MKKLVCLTLVLCLYLSLITPINASTDKSIEEKADALYALSILKGNGIDYNLEGNLVKSEATVFITRLLGKEEEIIENKYQYSETIFPDVPLDAWFAPYVGYCTQLGIITGFDGKFSPKANISEKSFLSAVLRAMGYIYGSDFTWSNVYEKAYTEGLVTDVSYQEKTTDNNDYTRGEVVSVLYNALKLKKKDADISVLQELINSNIVSQDTAILSGIVSDTTESAVVQVDTVNEQNISVTFNENIKSIPSSGIQIYETGNPVNELTAEIVSVSGNQAVLTTSYQTADRKYTLELNNIEDTYGNYSGKVTYDFTGYRNPKLQSDFFRISKVEAMNNKVVNLYFTHPINTSSESTAYYEILENGNSFIIGSTQSLIIKKLNSVENGVTLFLKEKTFAEGMEYTIKINGGLISTYSVKLNEELGDSISFKAAGTEYEPLKVLSIAALGSNKVSVEFNREIDAGFAQKFLNYTIIAPDNSQIAVSNAKLVNEGDKRGRAVLLTLLSSLDKSKQYTLRLEYLPDIYRQSALEENNNVFLGTYPDKGTLGIDFVLALDRGTIWVAFDQPMAAEIATVNSLYLISGVSVSGYSATPLKVQYEKNDDQYISKLYLPSDKLLSGSSTYKLTVLSTIQDINGNNFARNSEINFSGSDTVIPKTGVSEAVIISKDTIKITFNKEIANDITNVTPSNYIIESNDSGSTIMKSPMFVSLIDSKVLILKFDSLDLIAKYKLRITTLKDLTGASVSFGTDANQIDVRMGR